MSMDRTHDTGPIEPSQLSLQSCWSIGLYRGAAPLALAPHGPNPVVLRGEDVTDVSSDFVADPFQLTAGGTHFLFFEIWNRARQRGEIACAASRDLSAWQYDRVVLSEPFHLSYPCVFASGSDIFMIPETREARSVRLYRADAFPHRWRFVRELLHGDFADATALEHGGRWWLFVHRGLDELRLYSAPGLHDEFAEHPASPIVAGNRRLSRPAGRLLAHDGRLLRFSQDAWPNYGTRVRALQIDQLSVEAYAEHELPDSPILDASGNGWNALGMHHVEYVPRPDGTWLALVDGQTQIEPR
jgi:hypothetical protein